MPTILGRRAGMAVLAMLAVSAAAQTAVPARGGRETAGRALVEGVTEPLENLKVSDLRGNDVATRVRPRAGEPGRIWFDATPSGPVVLKPRRIPTMAVPAGERVSLPGGAVVALPRTAADPAVARAVWFRLTLAASPTPAPWDEQHQMYRTNLSFGLKRPDAAPPGLTLEGPVVVKLSYQGLVAAETEAITLDQPGLEHEKTVALQFRPASEHPTLLVRSTLSDVDLQLAAVPRLDLLPARAVLLGLGLDTVSISVTAVEPDGRGRPLAHRTPVRVTVGGRAELVGESPVIAAGATDARFVVRSAGLGAVSITASADGLEGGTTVRQRFPTGPLLAALLGGALGGFARQFAAKARRVQRSRRIVEGLVVGLIAFVAGVLGVGYLHLPAAVVATEAGAFLTGALAGFAGTTVLESITRPAAARKSA